MDFNPQAVRRLARTRARNPVGDASDPEFGWPNCPVAGTGNGSSRRCRSSPGCLTHRGDTPRDTDPAQPRTSGLLCGRIAVASQPTRVTPRSCFASGADIVLEPFQDGRPTAQSTFLCGGKEEERYGHSFDRNPKSSPFPDGPAVAARLNTVPFASGRQAPLTRPRHGGGRARAGRCALSSFSRGFLQCRQRLEHRAQGRCGASPGCKWRSA